MDFEFISASNIAVLVRKIQTDADGCPFRYK